MKYIVLRLPISEDVQIKNEAIKDIGTTLVKSLKNWIGQAIEDSTARDNHSALLMLSKMASGLAFAIEEDNTHNEVV